MAELKFTKGEVRTLLEALKGHIHMEMNCSGAVHPAFIKVERKIEKHLGLEETEVYADDDFGG